MFFLYELKFFKDAIKMKNNEIIKLLLDLPGIDLNFEDSDFKFSIFNKGIL